MTAWAPFDPLEILRRLTARGVDFLVIGGFAAVVHGSPRITQDLDLTYAPEPANLAALGEVLTEVNVRLFGVEEDLPFVADERTLRGTEILTLDTDFGKLDLLAHPPGAPAYADMRASAQRVDVGGVIVAVVAIPDLLSMKQAAGRPKDLADIAELEEIERRSG